MGVAARPPAGVEPSGGQAPFIKDSVNPMPKPLDYSSIDGLKLLRRGKVRDVYDLGDKLLLVASDRVSAFDCVLSPPIPGKGAVLTRLSAFWFAKTASLVESHFLSDDLAEIRRALPAGIRLDPGVFEGRVTLARKAGRVDAECVVRGYLAGSAWKEYRSTGSVGGHALPKGLEESQRLPQPIFTPAAKADTGHDENISREELAKTAGKDVARELETLSLGLYRFAAGHLAAKGLLLADTKFEFGFIDGKLRLIDELLTPDSSRIWEAETYRPGTAPAGFDKQALRDWLERSGWDKTPPPPPLPAALVADTASRYREALRRIIR